MASAAPAPLASQQGGKHARTISFFGHDLHDSAIRKRAAAFEALGSHVERYMFRRARHHHAAGEQADFVDLGVTHDLDYTGRIVSLLASLPRILARRRELGESDIIYARNLDMLALAVLAKRLTGARAPLVYESLDVRRILIGDRLVNRLFRFAERRLLAATDLLVVSSPEYMTRYFRPLQGYDGAWRLIENKLTGEQHDRHPSPASVHLAPGPPWIIGWFGVLKCRRSLEILARVAELLGDKVEIHMRGILPESEIPAGRIEELCARHGNIVLGGPYANPGDLAEIYGRVHITWAADFLDPDANSAWCLPNRLYEGAAHGSVLLASSGTATAERIVRDGLGWALEEPLEETVPAFIEALSPDAYDAARRRVLCTPPDRLYDLEDTAGLVRVLDAIAARRLDGAAIAAGPTGIAAAGGER